MDITFKRGGSVALVHISTRERYAVKEIDWRIDWRLRFQVSLTPPGKRYGLGEPLSLGSGRFASTVPQVVFSVAGEMVVVEFLLPDSLRVLQSGSWGASAGGALPIDTGRLHCQALMYARAPGIDSVLRRSPEGLHFCATRLGEVDTIFVLPWSEGNAGKRFRSSNTPEPRTVKETGSRFRNDTGSRINEHRLGGLMRHNREAQNPHGAVSASGVRPDGATSPLLKGESHTSTATIPKRVRDQSEARRLGVTVEALLAQRRTEAAENLRLHAIANSKGLTVKQLRRIMEQEDKSPR